MEQPRIDEFDIKHYQGFDTLYLKADKETVLKVMAFISNLATTSQERRD